MPIDKKTSKIVPVVFKKKFLDRYDKWLEMKGFVSRAAAIRQAVIEQMDSNSHLRRQPE